MSHLLLWKKSTRTDKPSRYRQPTYCFLAWWHSSTLKYLPYFLFNRMSCGCLILTPKYQLASRMNSIFPFWTNARLVDSADVSTGPVSNGLRVTGGPGRVVKLAHLSRPILLLLLQYIRLQRENSGLDSDTRGTKSAIRWEERRRGELSMKPLEMRISDPANVYVCVCDVLQCRLLPWKTSTPWLVSFWCSASSRAAGRFLCSRLMTAQGTEFMSKQQRLSEYFFKLRIFKI